MSTDVDLSQGTGLDVTVTRALNALAMHLAGATDPQIAKQLGFASAQHARHAWELTLAESVTDDDRAKARRTEVARLDRMQLALWAKATDAANPEQATAVRLVLNIMERRARMLGLDAPTRMEVYTPSAVEIAEYVEAVRRQMGVTDEVEPDIVDVEIVTADSA